MVSGVPLLGQLEVGFRLEDDLVWQLRPSSLQRLHLQSMNCLAIPSVCMLRSLRGERRGFLAPENKAGVRTMAVAARPVAEEYQVHVCMWLFLRSLVWIHCLTSFENSRRL